MLLLQIISSVDKHVKIDQRNKWIPTQMSFITVVWDKYLFQTQINSLQYIYKSIHIWNKFKRLYYDQIIT